MDPLLQLWRIQAEPCAATAGSLILGERRRDSYANQNDNVQRAREIYIAVTYSSILLEYVSEFWDRTLTNKLEIFEFKRTSSELSQAFNIVQVPPTR